MRSAGLRMMLEAKPAVAPAKAFPATDDCQAPVSLFTEPPTPRLFIVSSACACTLKLTALMAPKAHSGAPTPLYIPESPSFASSWLAVDSPDRRRPGATACIRHLTVSMGWMTVRPTMPASCPEAACTQGEGDGGPAASGEEAATPPPPPPARPASAAVAALSETPIFAGDIRPKRPAYRQRQAGPTGSCRTPDTPGGGRGGGGALSRPIRRKSRETIRVSSMLQTG
mmetsp:Transcript_6643/g.18541  ORF Transcript_6643/g.18541 Transcript_6643/m.18541 type:complete len:227 (-) Transcript_6643:251-931(-)